jgi:hypothetical protein
MKNVHSLYEKISTLFSLFVEIAYTLLFGLAYLSLPTGIVRQFEIPCVNNL